MFKLKKTVTFCSLFLLLIFVGIFFKSRLCNFENVHDLVTLPEKKSFHVQEKLKAFHPVLVDQTIVAIVIANDCADLCERNLDSLIEQNYPRSRIVYIDNGSKDDTYIKANNRAHERAKDKKISFFQYKSKKPEMEILYDVIKECDPSDIVVFVDGADWLAHENVFTHLNHAYANPEIWMTHSREIDYPEYKKVAGVACCDQTLLNKKLRHHTSEKLRGLKSFYAGFFKEIRLQDLLFEGKFIGERGDFPLVLPLVEMGPTHVFFMDEVSYVRNSKKASLKHKADLDLQFKTEKYLSELSPYQEITQLKLNRPSSLYHYEGDLVVFSEDSPLHLYACLESLALNVGNINQIFVIYKGSDKEFERAYLNLQNEFPKVSFLDVCDYPGRDFQTLLSTVFLNQRDFSPYVLIMDDHLAFEERVSLHKCIETMEKVHTDYFFFDLDEKMIEKETLPYAFPINRDVYAWQMSSSPKFSVNLCRKQLFEEILKLENLTSFSDFKELWQKQLQSHAVGLFFEEKKILSLKWEKEIPSEKKKEWSHKFIEGFKIDLASLLYEKEAKTLPLIKRKS